MVALFGLSDEVLGAIIGGVCAIVAAILAAWLTGRATSRKVKDDFDLDLSNRQVDAYEELGARLEPLAFHSDSSTPTRNEQLESLRRSLRKWYYDEGRGIHFSERSRDFYLALQNELEQVVSTSVPAVGDEELRRLKDAASALRTSMKGDLGIK